MAAQDDKEKSRILFNFLDYYNLSEYYGKLVKEGVTTISHLKATSYDSLRAIGFKGPEIDRIKKKLAQNFEGNFIKKKSATKRFNKESEKWRLVNERMQQPTEETVEGENPYVAEPHEVLIPSEHLTLGRPLGKGEFCSVHSGQWNNNGHKMSVAIKTIPLNEVGVLVREYQSLVKIKHPNVIKLYGLSIDKQPMLVEELAPGGSLLDHLLKEGYKINIEMIKSYCLQIARGMDYLSRHKVVHRDLAARNVLLSQHDTVKICDFGMARVTEATQPQLMSLTVASYKVSYPWAAMETLTHSEYSTSSDVWSYGVTMWEIFSQGRTPWRGLDMHEVCDHLRKGNRLGRPKLCSTAFYKIIAECWRPDPSFRPSFKEIIEKLSKIEVEKVVSLVTVRSSDENLMDLREGEMIYITSWDDDREYVYGVSSSGSVGFCKVADTTNDLGHANPISRDLPDLPFDSSRGQLSESQYVNIEDDHAYEEPMTFNARPRSNVGGGKRQGDTAPKNGRKLSTSEERDSPVMPMDPYVKMNSSSERSETISPSGVYEQPYCSDDEDLPVPISNISPGSTPHLLTQPVPAPRSSTVARHEGVFQDVRTSGSGSDPRPYEVATSTSHTHSGPRSTHEDPATLHGYSRPRSTHEDPAPLHRYDRPRSTHEGPTTLHGFGHPRPIREDPTTLHGYDRPRSTSHPVGLPPSLLTQGSQSQGQQMRGNSDPTEHLTSTFRKMDVVGEYSELNEADDEPTEDQHHVVLNGRSQPEISSATTVPHQLPISETSQSTDDADMLEKISCMRTELPSVLAEDCQTALQQSKGDVQKAVFTLKVDMLMKMQFPYINPEDCRNALQHCQQKVDRAAEWLLEKSCELSSKII